MNPKRIDGARGTTGIRHSGPGARHTPPAGRGGSPARLRILLGLACSAVLVGATPAVSAPAPETLEYGPAHTVDPGHDRAPGDTELPAATGTFERALGDTTLFGYIDANGLAVPGEAWTWDHGHPTDPFEGWSVIDANSQNRTFFRRIDVTGWTAPETGNLVAPPILSGIGSAWVGAYELEADTLCWDGGLGYGNSWNQRLVSPVLENSGTGDVILDFTYFSDLELNFDYMRIYVRRLPTGDELPIVGGTFTGKNGLAVSHPADPPVGVTHQSTVPAADLAGAPQFQLVFEVDTDGGWSDQDGSYETEYGPFAVDDLVVSGGVVGGPLTYDFEIDLGGWTADATGGPGPYLVLADVSAYDIQDACQCDLTGNVLAFHDAMNEHPYGQRQLAVSNAADVASVPDPGSGLPRIFAVWDQYSEMPLANGVFFRPGWLYYPHTCIETGIVGWSPRAGQPTFQFVGETPLCTRLLNVATSNGIPTDAELVRFVFEVYASCDAFGIDPSDCSGITNATPILDNVQIGVVYQANAPSLSWENGRYLTDGFSQSDFNDPFTGGNADCPRNTNFGNTPPVILADVPQVNGPVGTVNPWDVRLHFRVHREGPGATHANFASWTEWKNRTGVGVGPTSNFAIAAMDTLEVAGSPAPNRDRYVGYYREDDPNNPSPGTELVDANEILVDNVPPGSRIDYFVGSNYRTTPGEVSLLPDTTGGNYLNFEILPHWRDEGGILKFPSILYIDADNRGSEFYIASALDGLGYTYDIYDRLDTSCCWTAPFARGPEPQANGGMTVTQLRDYRAVLANFGRFTDVIYPEDGRLLDEWLTAQFCESPRIGLLANGDGVAEGIGHVYPTLLTARLGALVQDESYGGDIGDENFCVDLESVSGALFGTTNSVNGAYEYSAWGNACPNEFDFSVLTPVVAGVGNRAYINADTGAPTSYAQIVTENLGAAQSYRTVLDGTSWHHLIDRAGPGDPNCAPAAAAVIVAIENELAAAMEWIFDGSVPGLTEPSCLPAADVPQDTGMAAPVTRLHANQPNPFNPRTTLRFSLSQRQNATLAIYDVSGRRVRTLMETELDGGMHEVVWDGTDDAGRPLAAGVYWSQLTTPDFNGSKKMIVLD